MMVLAQETLPDRDKTGQDSERRLSYGLRILAHIIARSHLNIDRDSEIERNNADNSSDRGDRESE